MIRFYYHATPNPAKVALMLEETGLAYEAHPVDTGRGEQHLPGFRAINPNGKVPAIVDTDGPGGKAVRVLDSTAILMYLAEKADRLLGAPQDRPELLSWLMFVATGLGPFSGQLNHFRYAAPAGLAYAVNRYQREVERHYAVLDAQIGERSFVVGHDYTIVDIAAWGWVARAPKVFGDETAPLGAYPHVARWFATVDARPAAARARALLDRHRFKTELDDDARRALYPSNYPAEATTPR